MSDDAALKEAIDQLDAATAAKKCWQCGCLHQTLEAIDRSLPLVDRPEPLDRAVTAARSKLTTVRYDCIGCDPCYPAVAVNALNARANGKPVELAPCATDAVEERAGWPPLPGTYVVKRYNAPVAICTLTDEALARGVATVAGAEVGIVGACQTENLGLERLITNVLANPNLRVVLLCGPDTRQAVGHLPGQSLLALVRNGLDANGKIIDARGKRPVIKNVSAQAVEHFRRHVEVVDLIGETDVTRILTTARDLAGRTRAPAPAFSPERTVKPIRGAIPEHMVPDKTGYFVIDPDRPRRVLRLEHYSTAGVLDVVVEGQAAAELYCTAIERGLVSRLDHAAYLGKELARAERALTTGETYVQDAAPERSTRPRTLTALPKLTTSSSSCGCEPSSSCEASP